MHPILDDFTPQKIHECPRKKGPSQQEFSSSNHNSIEFTGQLPDYRIGFLSDPDKRKEIFSAAFSVWIETKKRLDRNPELRQAIGLSDHFGPNDVYLPVDDICQRNQLHPVQVGHVLTEGIQKGWKEN